MKGQRRIDMSTTADPPCAGRLQAVVGREQQANYTLDTLACGHTVADYDNRRPRRRRCPGRDGNNYSLRADASREKPMDSLTAPEVELVPVTLTYVNRESHDED